MSDDAGTLQMNINGKPVALTADPDTPLLYVLRGELAMKGARFGCGAGLCGACMVIIDGRAVPACDVPVGTLAGCKIETIEALSAGDRNHPLVDALIEAQAGQCGYCLPGIVMTVKALLDANPSSGRAQIARALDGNLCRCGAHSRILRAIETAAARMAEAER